MGNGPWSGRSSGRRLVWVGAFGATVVLLVAGSALLELGSRRSAEKALAPLPASPVAASSRALASSLSSSSLKSKPQARAILGQLPLIFEPNQGQADPKVKFLARGAGYGLFLDATGAVLAMQTGHAASSSPSSSNSAGSGASAGPSEEFVSMKLAGANPAATTSGRDLLPGKSNYITGNDPKKWHKDIPQYAGVRYTSVYPGIDLVFYGNQGRLEYDFRVAPGGDPSQAELQFSGAASLELSDGDLILTGKNDGGLRLRAPQIYQRDGDRREPVAGHFVLRAANRVGFEIGTYDRKRELVIDPVLSFSTYFGGVGSETSPSVAVNGDGFIYIVGSTTSAGVGFPPAGASLTIGPAANIFVSKINPGEPPSVVYTTFLGGSGGPGADTSVGIGVDNGGNTYIVGNSTSQDFPTNNTNVLGYQTTPKPKGPQCAGITCTSVIVSVLNALGSTLTYSTYLSGNGNDQATGMTIDAKGDVFVTGTTTSDDEPLTDAFPATQLPVPFQSVPEASIQFFVTKINTIVPSVGGIAYSTYFGGGTPTTPIVTGGGIAVDTTGNMYFSGTTNFYNSGSGVYGNSGQSEDFPILNSYQPCLDTPPPTVLLNPNPCFQPTTTPYPSDAFVAKINPLAPAGTQLLFSTYLGGTSTDSGTAVTVDSGAANVYLTGSTNSSDFIQPTNGAPYQLCLDTPPATPPVLTCPVITQPAPFDAFVARMSNPTPSTTGVPNFVTLNYFSYLGGGANDYGNAIAVDSTSDALITGTTSSTNFPVTTGALQPQLGAGATSNAFFAHIDTTTITGQSGASSYVTYYGGNRMDRGTGIAVDLNLNTYFVGDTTSTNLQVEDWLQNQLNGPSDAFVVKLGTATDLCITCVAPVYSVTNPNTVSAGNQLTITFQVVNNGPDPATNIAVNGTVPAGVTFLSATAGSGTCSPPSGNAVVCQIPALQAGSISPVNFVVIPITAGNFQATAQVFSANNTNSNSTATAPFVAGGFSMTMAPSSQTVSAGLPGLYAVNVTPQPVFGAAVSLTCSALPTGATCAFSPSSLNFGNQGTGAQSAVLNVTTTAQPETTITAAPWTRPFYAFWLMVPGMALLGVGAGGKRRARVGKKTGRILGLLALSIFFAMVLLQPSCSTSKTQPTVSGTPSGTYALTVTATSGSYTKTVPFSLTVVP
jgi:uncharacterized repeat protein (TIGR01451 family)